MNINKIILLIAVFFNFFTSSCCFKKNKKEAAFKKYVNNSKYVIYESIEYELSIEIEKILSKKSSNNKNFYEQIIDAEKKENSHILIDTILRKYYEMIIKLEDYTYFFNQEKMAVIYILDKLIADEKNILAEVNQRILNIYYNLLEIKKRYKYESA